VDDDLHIGGSGSNGFVPSGDDPEASGSLDSLLLDRLFTSLIVDRNEFLVS
jgi:hypothetical protein